MVQLLIFMMSASLMEFCDATAIDWGSIIKDDFHKFLYDFNDGNLEKMVYGLFAPGFTLIDPNGIIQGDYGALLESYRKLYNGGYRIQDIQSHVLSPCGHYAVEWHRYVIHRDGKVSETGVTTVLLEYTDGKALLKFSIFTPTTMSTLK